MVSKIPPCADFLTGEQGGNGVGGGEGGGLGVLSICRALFYLRSFFFFFFLISFFFLFLFQCNIKRLLLMFVPFLVCSTASVFT